MQWYLLILRIGNAASSKRLLCNLKKTQAADRCHAHLIFFLHSTVSLSHPKDCEHSGTWTLFDTRGRHPLAHGRFPMALMSGRPSGLEDNLASPCARKQPTRTASRYSGVLAARSFQILEHDHGPYDICHLNERT